MDIIIITQYLQSVAREPKKRRDVAIAKLLPALHASTYFKLLKRLGSTVTPESQQHGDNGDGDDDDHDKVS